MITPEYVLMNHNITGRCVSSDTWPHFVIKGTNTPGCNFKVKRERRVVAQGTNKIYCTDFVVKSVTATCEYMCAFKHSKLTKTIVVTGL